MSTARKVIEWKKNDVGGLARAFDDLPDGRYVVVRETEFDAESADSLDRAEIDEVNVGIDAADRGEVHDWDEVNAEVLSVIASALRGGRGVPPRTFRNLAVPSGES